VTLTEFLLARIAEDEWIANTASGIVAGPAQMGKDLWNFGDQRLEVTKRRVLAECEAKRRIVVIAVDQMRLGDEARGWDNWRDMAMQNLHALALPYADHPDYDEEWRA